jgi:hypothetical protein
MAANCRSPHPVCLRCRGHYRTSERLKAPCRSHCVYATRAVRYTRIYSTWDPPGEAGRYTRHTNTESVELTKRYAAPVPSREIYPPPPPLRAALVTNGSSNLDAVGTAGGPSVLPWSLGAPPRCRWSRITPVHETNLPGLHPIYHFPRRVFVFRKVKAEYVFANINITINHTRIFKDSLLPLNYLNYLIWQVRNGSNFRMFRAEQNQWRGML